MTPWMTRAGKAIGWRKPTSRLDYAQWIITALLFVGIMLWLVGREGLAFIAFIAVLVSVAAMLHKRPTTAAMLAVAILGALPAGAALWFFPAWQTPHTEPVMTLWMIVGTYPALLASLLTLDNRPLRAAMATAAPVAGSLITAFTSREITALLMPVAILVSTILLGRWQAASTALPGTEVTGARDWKELGALLVPMHRGDSPIGYSNGEWLVVAWPGRTSQKTAHEGAVRLADFADLPRENVQPVVISRTRSSIERADRHGNILAIVPEASLAKFLQGLPPRKRLTRQQRGDLRLHLTDAVTEISQEGVAA